MMIGWPRGVVRPAGLRRNAATPQDAKSPPRRSASSDVLRLNLAEATACTARQLTGEAEAGHRALSPPP